MGIIRFIKEKRARFTFILFGIISLVWFLIRVIPKPSRAAYPCQRAAFPIASAFVIWLTGAVGGICSIQNAKKMFHNKRMVSLGLFTAGIVLILFTYLFFPTEYIFLQAKSLFSNEPVLKAGYNQAIDQTIDPKSTVAIIRSEKSNVADITKADVEAMIRKAVEMAGGLNNIITDGDTVVLKPNLVFCDYKGSALPVEANGMVTDWRIVAATAKIVRELNPHGTIIVMEGSAGYCKTSNAFNLLKYSKTYIPEVDYFYALEEVSGNFQDFNSAKLVSATLPESVKLYPDNLKRYNSPKYYYNKIYYNADVLISLPVLKNHDIAGTTGAVKNLGIGATPSNIYSAINGYNGRWNDPSGEKAPISHDPYYLHRWIHDYYYGRPADFAIMDGLQGYSYGPGYDFEPPGGFNIKNQQQNMRIILASKDPIALDAIEALTSGDDPLKVTHLVYLNNDGMGCADANAIKVSGTRVYAVKKNFGHASNQSFSDAKDFTAPGSSVNYVHYSAGNILNISLKNDSDVTKVEIVIDGQEYNKIIISRFNSISIDLGQYQITDSLLTIYAQDRFLNSDVFMIKGNYPNIFIPTGNYPKDSSSVPRTISDQKLYLYPNPSSDIVNIQLNTQYKGTLNFVILDQGGKQLYKTSGNKQTTVYTKQFDISRLSKGNYIFTVFFADNSSVSKKISKK